MVGNEDIFEIDGKRISDEQLTMFCAKHIELNNIYRAYIAAGFAKEEDDRRTVRRKASVLFHTERCQEIYKTMADQLVDDSVMDAHEVLTTLTDLARNEETEEVILAVGVGSGVQEARKIKKDINGLTRIKALELLGKASGLFSDKLQIEGKIPVVISDDVTE